MHISCIENKTDILKITGFVGKPEFAKKTRGEQLFYVNQRFIKSGYLNHAIMGAYEDILNKDTYPLYVVFLEIDPARIDINVHPTKTEIKKAFFTKCAATINFWECLNISFLKLLV